MQPFGGSSAWNLMRGFDELIDFTSDENVPLLYGDYESHDFACHGGDAMKGPSVSLPQTCEKVVNMGHGRCHAPDDSVQSLLN